jgi:hypothetical protein
MGGRRGMMKNLVAALAVLVIAAPQTFGQLRRQEQPKSSSALPLTGNPRLDLLAGMGGIGLKDTVPAGIVEPERGRKSPLLAGLFSVVLPGAGEYYAESHWRAGGFLVAEASLWIVYAVYSKKGDNQTTIFQNYADAHWSVVLYAEWIEQNATKLNPNATSITGLVTGPPNLPPWQRVDWDRLNASEDLVAQVPGNGFTHRLPHRPEQQYYELIGKYPQFASGWDDGGYITPEDVVTSNVSQRFLDYSKMRGKANDFYNVASTMASLVVANHVLSALDAAWAAWQHNNNLKLEAHVVPTNRGEGFVEFVPTATLALNF